MKNWIIKNPTIDSFDWGINDINLSNIIKSEIFENRIYERFVQVNEGDIVVDIGANVGAFSYSILEKKPSKVICIEPSNTLYKTLQKNLCDKGIEVHIENRAIRDVTSDNEIIVKDVDVIYKNNGSSFKTIKFKDFTDKYELNYIDFLKIDCEGAEYHIFTEENREFLTKRVGHISGEWHVWGFENVVEKFIHFRDSFLIHYSEYRVYDRDDNDVTDKIFSDDYIRNYSLEKNHSGQFIVYATNKEALKMKNWMLTQDKNITSTTSQEIKKESLLSKIRVNKNLQKNKRAFIIDNFYEDPYAVREYALQQEFFDDPGYIGRRTRTQHLFPGLKELFENIVGEKISEWESYPMNGRFQHNWAGEKLVYHCDQQRWAAMIYLTPDAPPETGTTMYRHKETKIHHNSQIDWNAGQGLKVFNQKTFLDRTPYEPVDVFGNIFNRLVIFDGGCIHAASEYFGSNINDCRLWQMFFFDGEVSNIHMGR